MTNMLQCNTFWIIYIARYTQWCPGSLGDWAEADAAAAAAAAGLAHRCCISGERNTGDKWAPLAPHD